MLHVSLHYLSECLCCFHFLAVMNYAAVNIYVFLGGHMLLVLMGLYLGMELFVGLDGICMF